MSNVASDYDEPWKEVCDTCFQKVLELSCPSLVTDIDWTHPIQFLDTELQAVAPAAKVRRQHVDHLAQVLWKPSGGPVLIHTEVQSQVEPRLPRRLFDYSTTLEKIHGMDVISLALLADPNPGFHPKRYLRERAGCQHEFQFLTCKFLDFDRDFLEASPNPVAKVVLAHRLAQETATDPRARLEAKMRWIEKVLSQGFPEPEKRILLRALDWMNPLPRELAIEFHRFVQQHPTHKIMPYLTSFEEFAWEKALAQGLSQGLSNGITKGQLLTLRESIRDLLEERFGIAPGEILDHLEEQSDPALLRTWHRRAATIETLDAFRALIGV
jgi:hypothetical protein